MLKDDTGDNYLATNAPQRTVIGGQTSNVVDSVCNFGIEKPFLASVFSVAVVCRTATFRGVTFFEKCYPTWISRVLVHVPKVSPRSRSQLSLEGGTVINEIG